MRLRGQRPPALAVAVVAAALAGVTMTAAGRIGTKLPGDIADYGRTSTIGALFTVTASGQLQDHFCTASVVDSPAGNLVVTAAHCLRNQSAGRVAFVPDYAAGRTPYGVWTVTKVIEDRQWMASGSPDDDFAFMVVSQPGSSVPVQHLTGGAVVGISAPADRPVLVAGYPNVLDTPVSCENKVRAYSGTQYEFDCAGFTDGTSGSPLLARQPGYGVAMVIGVIGGYQQGGDTASVSYAARFGNSFAGLYRMALAGQ